MAVLTASRCGTRYAAAAAALAEHFVDCPRRPGAVKRSQRFPM
jgi:hypothetical protein